MFSCVFSVSIAECKHHGCCYLLHLLPFFLISFIRNWPNQSFTRKTSFRFLQQYLAHMNDEYINKWQRNVFCYVTNNWTIQWINDVYFSLMGVQTGLKEVVTLLRSPGLGTSLQFGLGMQWEETILKAFLKTLLNRFHVLSHLSLKYRKENGTWYL